MTSVILRNSVYRKILAQTRKSLAQSRKSLAQKTYDDRYFNNDGVDFYVYALLISKSKPGPENLKFQNPKSIPREVASSLDADQKEEAKEAGAAGNLWFLKLEKVGWDWTSQSGAKGAEKVQEALNYLQRFKSKDKVGGVEAIYIEINNKQKSTKKSASLRRYRTSSSEGNKYIITEETNSIGLRRIQALRDIPRHGVKAGDLGGWVESEDSLDQNGDAWVSGNAQVSGDGDGDAWVSGNALVSGNARVYGDARVFENAKVFGSARVSENALVYGKAQVYGSARVSGYARVYGNADVSGSARVYGNADVSGNEIVDGY